MVGLRAVSGGFSGFTLLFLLIDNQPDDFSFGDFKGFKVPFSMCSGVGSVTVEALLGEALICGELTLLIVPDEDGGGGIGGAGEAIACNFPGSKFGFDVFVLIVLKKLVFPFGDATEDDNADDFGGVTGIGIGWLVSAAAAGGIVTVREGGVLGPIAGVWKGDAGVFGATSLASESPSCVRPGGSKGVCDGDNSETEPWGGVSSVRNPSATRSRSTAW